MVDYIPSNGIRGIFEVHDRLLPRSSLAVPNCTTWLACRLTANLNKKTKPRTRFVHDIYPSGSEVVTAFEEWTKPAGRNYIPYFCVRDRTFC